MASFILRVPTAKKNPYPKEMISFIRSHECDHCYEEDYILEIKDIRDGYVYLENIKPEWKVKFMKKIVTYEEVPEVEE